MITLWVNQTTSCQCGSSLADVCGEPLTRLLCHCEICQSVYQQAYADVLIFSGRDVSLPDDHAIEFRRHRLPPALTRGACPQCRMPVVAFMRTSPFHQLAFVPRANFRPETMLPGPAMHIFYHRRVADMDDAVPKVDGYFPSETSVLVAVTKALLQRRPEPVAHARSRRGKR